MAGCKTTWLFYPVVGVGVVGRGLGLGLCMYLGSYLEGTVLRSAPGERIKLGS